MAWALQFDGVNDYATFPTWTATGDYTVTLTLLTGDLSANAVPIGDSTTNNNYIAALNSASFVAQINARGTTAITGALVATEYDVTLVRVGANNTLTVSGLGSGVRSRTGNFTLNSFGSILAGLNFDGQLRGQISLDNNAGDVRLYDIDASNHGSGTVTILDTLGGNDATGVNMPTDGSAWIDLGGGGGVVMPVTMNSYRQRRA